MDKTLNYTLHKKRHLRFIYAIFSKIMTVTAYKYQDLYDNTSNPQDLDNDSSTPNIYVKHSNEDLQQQGLKSEFTIDSDSFASLFGLELGQRDYENSSETLADYNSYNYTKKKYEKYYAGETSNTNSKERVQALYGELKYNVTSKLTTTVNARYNILKKEYITDSYDYNGSVWSDNTTNESHTFRNTAYRAGATYSLDDASNFFTSVSTGFQNPEARDLANDPTIKEQTSINYEIGYKGINSVLDNNLNYEVSIFQLDNKDILGREDGTYDFSSPMTNIGDSRSRGLELSLNSDLTKTLSFNLAYTYLDVVYTKHNPLIVTMQDKKTMIYDVVGNTLPRVSKHTVDLFLNYNVTNELKLISEIYARSSYYADETNTVKFNGYELLNLQARYNTKLFGNSFEFFVKVDNVFDKQYYRSAFGYNDKRGVYGLDPEDVSITVDPGRVYYAGIKYTF